MPNYENIKPYADFAHTAAEHGGVENYLNEFGQKNYELGVADEKATEMLKAAILVLSSLALWEGGRRGVHWIKNRFDDQRKTIEIEIENAKEQIIRSAEEQGCTANMMEHQEDMDTEVDD